ncbi:MAG: Gx transporter family protein [Lachnospiraceae bacterium]|nr:Gx transporter family protein [Lachnospiraceae bacterium]
MKKKTAFLGMFVTLALIASYVESLVPFYFGAPGIKLGLANLITVVVLYRMGVKDAFLVSVLRIILAGFLFGNVFSILYSLAGGIFSLLVMLGLKKMGSFSIVGVSVAGGISHNLGQIGAAILLMENGKIIFYFPILMAAGIVTGLLIGIGSREVLKRVPAF